jgi:hypothetical protein
MWVDSRAEFAAKRRCQSGLDRTKVEQRERFAVLIPPEGVTDPDLGGATSVGC